MFSGIVEATSPVTSFAEANGVIRIRCGRPREFSPVALGDSICVNGTCLTVEKFDDHELQFALGAETIRLLQLTKESIYFRHDLNLEQSLAFGSRVHGHFVSGHVDQLVTLKMRSPAGDSLDLWFELAGDAKNYIWPKGSVTLHGTSLTVNVVRNDLFSVCLVPETLRRTNLSLFQVGDRLNVEFDWMAKAFHRQFENYLKVLPEKFK